jgi:hypothetical protein
VVFLLEGGIIQMLQPIFTIRTPHLVLLLKRMESLVIMWDHIKRINFKHISTTYQQVIMLQL